MNCINSLMSSEDFNKKYQLEIIVVESNNEYDISYTFPENVKVIVPKEPFGFHRYLNIGIQNASGDFLALCNNDLIFHQSWFSEIVKVSTERRDILSFSPIDPTKELHKFSSDYVLGYKVTQHIKGWCLICKKEVFQKIKRLDNRFTFYYSDNDFALTLLYHGIKNAVVSASHVEHLHKIATKESSTEKDRFLEPDSAGKKIPKYLYHDSLKWILQDKRVLHDHLIYYNKWGNPNSMYRIAKYAESLNNLNLNVLTRILLGVKRAFKI
ncbi:glycosyltransferase [Flavobacteriaceae bacterium S356]|uniref:Glycosyltransferase n=1 Tax=Asprobacillus argus TaxID=3076534 RepID=A0ABU3LFM4_9FLAO|nr:glycosyltransferase [Flavobacteriaceae bacterium S356]